MTNHYSEKGFTISRSCADKPRVDSFYKHVHGDYEVLLFLSGDAEFIIENSVYKLYPFDLMLIRPQSYHFLDLKSDAQYERIVMNFLPDDLNAAVRDKLAGCPSYFKLKPDSEAVKLLIKFIGYCNRMDKAILNALKTGFLSELIVLLYEEKRIKAKGVFSDKLIDKALAFISENINMPLSTGTVAAGLFVSRSLICHKFSDVMKISLMEYIRIKKIYYAKNLLDGGATSAEAAKLSGFNEYATFYRCFKKYMGKTPSAKN